MHTFCAAINKRLEALRVLRVYKVHKRGIYPATGLNRIQSADHEVELHVIVVILILNLSVITRVIMRAKLLGNKNTYGVTFTPGTRFIMKSAATMAFG